MWKSEFTKTKNGSRFTKISLEFCGQDSAESRKNETKSLQSPGHMKQASSLPRDIETEVYLRKIAIIQKGWLKQILIWYIDLELEDPRCLVSVHRVADPRVLNANSTDCRLAAPLLIFRRDIIVEGDREVLSRLRECSASARCLFHFIARNICFVQIYRRTERKRERERERTFSTTKRCVCLCFFALPTSIQEENKKRMCVYVCSMCVFEGKKNKRDA